MTQTGGAQAMTSHGFHHPNLRSRHFASGGTQMYLRLLLLGFLHLTAVVGRPLLQTEHRASEARGNAAASTSQRLTYLGIAILLTLTGGAFAGLTIALMGQDELYLRVISTSGEETEKKHATRVLQLLERGKHWVLVTLLIGNVITNETLPIVLDKSVGDGYAAAISSTVLVIIFGEIIPQSICVRYGLAIGAWMAPIVTLIVWLSAPISYPIAKLLDHTLGESHGTAYKKEGLKTLISLHNTIQAAPGERLNTDQVSIIGSVLDLKTKSVGTIMTSIKDVFVLPADAVLDEELVFRIAEEGYSRIPVHNPSDERDFIGMLMSHMLITYDSKLCRKVNEFALAPLPQTVPDTSCLDIINFFQQGNSHLALVSKTPGRAGGALGVVTLEDVLEELIGEEIFDESDLSQDLYKTIWRFPHKRATAGPTVAGLSAQISSERNSRISRLRDLRQRNLSREPASRKRLVGAAMENDIELSHLNNLADVSSLRNVLGPAVRTVDDFAIDYSPASLAKDSLDRDMDQLDNHLDASFISRLDRVNLVIGASISRPTSSASKSSRNGNGKITYAKSGLFSAHAKGAGSEDSAVTSRVNGLNSYNSTPEGSNWGSDSETEPRRDGGAKGLRKGLLVNEAAKGKKYGRTSKMHGEELRPLMRDG